jgi:hypothetical protein
LKQGEGLGDGVLAVKRNSRSPDGHLTIKAESIPLVVFDARNRAENENHLRVKRADGG